MNNQMLKSKVPTIIQIFIYFFSMVLLFMAFVPILMMIIFSFKSYAQIALDFWALPNPIHWENYNTIINMLIPNMANSTIAVLISTFFTVLLASVSGYVFARLNFPLKNFLYLSILSVMMIPAILTLTPSFKLMQDLRLYNTWGALLFPWVSGSQVLGILLCRTFISNHPASLFEAARIDGATEFQSYYKIALPLAKPIITTLAVMTLIGNYNDFIWPLMVIESNSKQMLTVALRTFQSTTLITNVGTLFAGFVFATIPLLVLFLFSSRLYIEGVTSGAIKT